MEVIVVGNAFNISWDPPREPGSTIKRYILSWRRNDTEDEYKKKDVLSNNYVIKNLGKFCLCARSTFTVSKTKAYNLQVVHVKETRSSEQHNEIGWFQQHLSFSSQVWVYIDKVSHKCGYIGKEEGKMSNFFSVLFV